MRGVLKLFAATVDKKKKIPGRLRWWKGARAGAQRSAASRAGRRRGRGWRRGCWSRTSPSSPCLTSTVTALFVHKHRHVIGVGISVVLLLLLLLPELEKDGRVLGLKMVLAVSSVIILRGEGSRAMITRRPLSISGPDKVPPHWRFPSCFDHAVNEKPTISSIFRKFKHTRRLFLFNTVADKYTN